MSDPVAWADYIPSIHIHVAHCPQPVMLDKLREAAKAFCTDSKIWQETLDGVYVSTSERAIEVEHPEGTRVIAPLDCYFGTDPLVATTPHKLAQHYSENWREESGQPKYITMDSPDIIRLCPHPETDGTLTPRAVLAPTLDSTEGPGWLYEDYRDALVHGALARLMVLPGNPWTNPQLAEYHGERFKFHVGQAFARQSRGFVSAPLRSTHVDR